MSRQIILIKQELLLLVYELNRSGLLAENEKIRPILAQLEKLTMNDLSSFFFQAEDGIRDKLVTGVQTCALPIYHHGSTRKVPQRPVGSSRLIGGPPIAQVCWPFRKAAAGCILLPWTQRRAFR